MPRPRTRCDVQKCVYQFPMKVTSCHFIMCCWHVWSPSKGCWPVIVATHRENWWGVLQWYLFFHHILNIRFEFLGAYESITVTKNSFENITFINLNSLQVLQHSNMWKIIITGDSMNTTCWVIVKLKLLDNSKEKLLN